MDKGQQKNNVNKRQGNMVPPESSYFTVASPGYPNTAESQTNNKHKSKLTDIKRPLMSK